MAKLIGLFGTTEDPFRVWPITWGVDPADVQRAKARCEREQEQLAEALKVVWTKREALVEPTADTWSTKWRKYVKTRNYEEQLTTHKRAEEKLEAEEAAISRQFTEQMLDALFPTGTQGWLPEVKYVIWILPEDLRADLSPGELTLHRARLMMTEDSDALPPDQSDDDAGES